MKKLIRIAAAVAAAALLAALCAVGLSHLVYGRSLKATLYELELRRRFADARTPEAEARRLEAKRREGETPAVAPSIPGLAAGVRESERAGMQVFTLEGGDGPLVLYLHGGAYVSGFNAHQWRFMGRLARRTGCVIVAPAYHLAPHATYARAYDDLTGLYFDLLAAHPGRRVILMGDSAGGGLALGLAEALAARGDPLPERLVLFSPWVDVSMDNPDIQGFVAVEPMLHLELVKLHGRYWAGDADTHHWQVSPLFGEMAGLPPVTIYCGTRELLYPDILLARDRLADAGVAVELRVGRGLNHDWPLMPLPEADAALDEVAALVTGPSPQPDLPTGD